MMLGERKPFGGAVFIILVGVVVIQEIRVNWYKNRLSDNLEEPFIQSVLQTDHETTSVETTTLEATTFNTEETHTEAPPPSAPSTTPWKMSAPVHNYTKCIIAEDVDWNREIHSKYKLDNSKFLTVVTLAGPNNQMRGFRETIFMAVKLNRTIIPAPFFKHSKTDPTAAVETDIVPEYLRLDLNSLRNLVSTVSSATAKQHCGDNFGAFFKTRPICGTVNNIRLRGVCSHLKMSCQVNGKFVSTDCPNLPIPVLPTDDRVYDHDLDRGRGYDFGRMDTLDKINHYYDSDEKCAILGFPYMSVSFHLAETNRISKEDKQLMVDIISMTQRPVFVRNAVTAFLDNMEPPFVAMHWRYNQDDWLHGGCSKRTDDERKDDRKDKEKYICDRVKLMSNPSIMAVQIQKFVNKTKDIHSMYIASPPSEIELMLAMREELKKINPNFTVYLSVELLDFLEGYFTRHGCTDFEADKYEILSLADMEVCFRSKIFLSSIGSSWSGNLNMERRLSNRSSHDKSNTILMPNPADFAPTQ